MYQGKNRYFKNPKISEGRFRRLLKAFALDLTASDAARLTDISICSVNTIYLRMRLCIAEYCEAQSPYSGEIELDGPYFGPKRNRGNRGRGAVPPAVELATGYYLLHFCYPPLGASTIHMFGSIVPNWRRSPLNMHYAELPIASTPSCHCKHECSNNTLPGTRFRTLSAARL